MGKKKKKTGRKPRALGKRLVASSKYIVYIKKVGPFVFQELREKFNIDRDPYKRVHHVPETGADLKFPYDPPDSPPLKEDDLEEWTLYHEYRNWLEDFETDVAEYTRRRNTLLLNLAVTHIEHKDPRVDVEYEMSQGSWIEHVQNAGITVDDQNQRYMFLKTVVLEDEQDYLTAINEAIAEEVSLGDVLRAFEYFQDVLERSRFGENIPELTDWKQWVVSEAVGSEDGGHIGQVS